MSAVQRTNWQRYEQIGPIQFHDPAYSWPTPTDIEQMKAEVTQVLEQQAEDSLDYFGCKALLNELEGVKRNMTIPRDQPGRWTAHPTHFAKDYLRKQNQSPSDLPTVKAFIRSLYLQLGEPDPTMTKILFSGRFALLKGAKALRTIIDPDFDEF